MNHNTYKPLFLTSGEKNRKLIANLAARGLLIESLDDPTPSMEFNGQKYHLIGPDSPINGGFITDIGSTTAVLVDTQRDADLSRLIEHFSPIHARVATAKSRKEGLVGLATIISQGALPYNEPAVLEKYHADTQTHQKSPTPRYLGEFIRDRAGICAHQALFTCAFLEHGIASHQLPEEFTVGFQSIVNYESGESHAYATLHTGTDTWIIDPTEPTREKRAYVLDGMGTNPRHDTISSP